MLLLFQIANSLGDIAGKFKLTHDIIVTSISIEVDAQIDRKSLVSIRNTRNDISKFFLQILKFVTHRARRINHKHQIKLCHLNTCCFGRYFQLIFRDVIFNSTNLNLCNAIILLIQPMEKVSIAIYISTRFIHNTLLV